MGKQKDVKMPEIDFSEVENPSYSPEKNFVLVTKKLMKFIKRWCHYHDYVLYGYSKICKYYLSGSVDYVKTTILNGIKEQKRLLDSISHKERWQGFLKEEHAFIERMEDESKKLETIDADIYKRITAFRLSTIFGNDNDVDKAILIMMNASYEVSICSSLLIDRLKDKLKFEIECYEDGKRFEAKLEKQSKAIEKKIQAKIENEDKAMKKLQAKIKKEDSPH